MKKTIVMWAVLCAAGAAFAGYKVGVFADKGPHGIGALEWFGLVEEAPRLDLELVDAADVRAGALEKLDLLVMPGGSSAGEYQVLQDEGMERVRDFIRKGGGYLGTCAGCFLTLDQDRAKAKRLHIVPYGSVSAPSGTIFLKHRFTDAGRAAFGITNETQVVRFHGGAIMKPTTNVIEGASFEVWANFDDPVAPKGAAILGGTYGRGRVVVFGAHPEYFVRTVHLVDAALRWILKDPAIETVRRYRTRGAKTIGFLSTPVSKDIVRAVLKLRASPDYDLVPMDASAIEQNGLEHVDLLVFPAGKPRFPNPFRQKILEGFLAHGGRVILHEAGADILKEVASGLEGPAPLSSAP